MTGYLPVDNADEQDNFFSAHELSQLSKENVPHHVAIIMDGNRRWARENGLHPIAGHWKGVDALMDVVKAASDLGIKTLTVYAFSTENWGRSEKEVNALMDLFELSLIQQREAMLKNGVRLHQIGDITSFSPSFIETLEQSKTITADGKNIDLVLALNYGGRDEIRRAFQVIAQQCCDNKLKAEDITEETITDHLDTAQWPDPKLLIRTSGEKRISNFLLWQLSYTEVIFSNTLWPDFSPHTLLSTLLEYQQRTSRRGI